MNARLGFAVGLLCLIIIGVVLILMQPSDAPAPPRWTADQAAEILELRNVGLGYLENEQFAEADAELSSLVARLPEDEFGPRNLSVSRLLAVEAAPPEQAAEMSASLFAALDQWQAIAEPAAVRHVVRARGAKFAGDNALAISEYEAALRLDPSAAATHYELYDLLRNEAGATAEDQAFAELTKAYELQPDNVFLLTEVMILQATKQSPALAESATNAVELLDPFFESIQVNTRVDLKMMLEQVPQQVESGDWSAAMRTARITANVLRPDPVAQSDRRRVQPHALEFVLFDFSPERTAELRQAIGTEKPSDEELMFESSPLKLGDAPEWWDIGAIRDIVLSDATLDGQIDITVLLDNRLALLSRNTADAATWSVISDCMLPEGSRGIRMADLDDDADAPREDVAQTVCPEADSDVIVYGANGLTVVRNDFDAETGQRRWIPLTGDDAPPSLGNVAQLEFADIDADGDLDVVVVVDGANLQVLANRGNMTFAAITERSLLPDDVKVTALKAVDWDRDVDLDLLVGGSRPGVLENLRHGRLRFRELPPGEFDGLKAATGIEAYDDDGMLGWEVWTVGSTAVTKVATQRLPNGAVRGVEHSVVVDRTGKALRGVDFDNDGAIEMLIVDENQFSVWEQTDGGPAAMRYESPVAEAPLVVSNAAALHEPGRQIVLAAMNGELHVLNARQTGDRHWSAITLRAQQLKGAQASASGRINHLGIGSVVEMKTRNGIQTRMVNSAATHFGLGDVTTPDAVRVVWTNGVPRNVIRPSADELICEEQVLKGSCPYVYGWDGEKFTFITDLLWASPIGLKCAEDFVAPWRASEHLKIDGRLLAPRGDAYVLQVTEELWEAAYFDQIELLAVDHPADIDIFTNEKVASAEGAVHKLHTVIHATIPAEATLASGEDVTAQIAMRDEHYLKPFRSRIRQGLTDDWSLEMKLPGVVQGDAVRLFLTGWVFPSDTSLNVAASNNPDLPRSRPPSLWVTDANGAWVEALPMMGFPGGKTKTIAVDLTGHFTTDDPRIQIRSNMELFWDHIFYTVNEEPGKFRVTPLALNSADLHQRGVSAYEPGEFHGPHRYLYEQVRTEPVWPPMQGRFTRFGDVRPLLTESDDRLVVLGAGDEMTLQFEVPEGNLPDGWVRDFVMHNVGWDKDADLNTVYGASVEPLPFHAMTDYAHENGLPRELDPEYEEYLKSYQTREQPPVAFFSRFRRDVDPSQ